MIYSKIDSLTSRHIIFNKILPSFPSIKHSTVPQHGPFSLWFMRWQLVWTTHLYVWFPWYYYVMLIYNITAIVVVVILFLLAMMFIYEGEPTTTLVPPVDEGLTYDFQTLTLHQGKGGPSKQPWVGIMKIWHAWINIKSPYYIMHESTTNVVPSNLDKSGTHWI